MANLHLKLTIKVVYDTYGTSIEDLKYFLSLIPQAAASNGQFTQDSTAEVDE